MNGKCMSVQRWLAAPTCLFICFHTHVGPRRGALTSRTGWLRGQMKETRKGITKTKPLLVLQWGHEVHLFLCFQGGHVVQGDPGGQEDQQVQLGLGHPEQNKTKNDERRRQGKKRKQHTFYQSRTFCLSTVHEINSPNGGKKKKNLSRAHLRQCMDFCNCYCEVWITGNTMMSFHPSLHLR